MALLDWFVLILTVIVIVGYGIWKTRGSKNIQGYLLGGNEAQWWTVGLSVMATQASAITFLSTPGQAYHDGMGFAQFYFMLPIAMIIICITFIPLFYRLKVYTAYEFLENRFDLKTRSFTSLLFLIQRGLATGITIYAPAIIISSVMNWNLNWTTILVGVISIIYTVSGGTRAVHVTHRHQMIVILLSLFVIFFVLINQITVEYSFTENLLIAEANNKLELIDTEFNLDDRYNIWSSMAALFLFLSYFGTDQSQVQRYISGKSIKESRLGLIMNGIMKVPLQMFILFLGVLVFLFYQTHQAPIFFNSQVKNVIEESHRSDDLSALEVNYNLLLEEREETNRRLVDAKRQGNVAEIDEYKEDVYRLSLREKLVRDDVKKLIREYDEDLEDNDKDYVFISYILKYLPSGLVGLLLAVIFFAAMSSTASELNALAATSVVDIYKRLLVKDANAMHYVHASRIWTLIWGLVAILFASFGSLFENLIQFVNIIGSLFYGTILGIFLIAFYFKKIGANAVFFAAIVAETIVVIVYQLDIVPYLWLNVIGVAVVILIAHILQPFVYDKKRSA